jgi:hypothetical protein
MEQGTDGLRRRDGSSNTSPWPAVTLLAPSPHVTAILTQLRDKQTSRAEFIFSSGCASSSVVVVVVVVGALSVTHTPTPTLLTSQVIASSDSSWRRP